MYFDGAFNGHRIIKFNDLDFKLPLYLIAFHLLSECACDATDSKNMHHNSMWNVNISKQHLHTALSGNCIIQV